MHPHSDDQLGPGAARRASRGALIARRTRFLLTAQGLLVVGTAGIVFLCLRGLNPPAVAIPLFLAVVSVMFAAASAGIFALVVQIQLGEIDEDLGDDGHKPGGGSNDPPEPPAPRGGPAFDWERFEHEFRLYCERVPARA